MSIELINAISESRERSMDLAGCLNAHALAAKTLGLNNLADDLRFVADSILDMSDQIRSAYGLSQNQAYRETMNSVGDILLRMISD